MSDLKEEPFYIVVVDEVEHEDGSATYSFELDEKAQKGLAKLGLELSLYCAAYGLDIQEALDHIGLVGKSRETEQEHE